MMRSKKEIYSAVIILFCLLMGFLMTGSTFAEETKVWVYTKLPAVPEGLCIDSKNNLYATVSFTGELVKCFKAHFQSGRNITTEVLILFVDDVVCNCRAGIDYQNV